MYVVVARYLAKLPRIWALTALILVLQIAYAIATCDICQDRWYTCATTTPIKPESSVPVCNDQGQIQIDDHFCDADCQCTEGWTCSSLILGCSDIMQAKARGRCHSLAGLRNR